MKATHYGYLGKPWNRVLHVAIDGDTACGLPGIAMNRYQYADAKPVCLNCIRISESSKTGKAGGER